MTRKLFTFLIAFLATMSGAVWGQSGSGTSGDPYTGNWTSVPDALQSAGKVYLEDFHLTTSGVAFNITGQLELVITGECFIESTGDVAITLPESKGGNKDGNILTISSESTGILRIKGSGETAIGEGNSNKVGEIDIAGGTVYILGNLGSMGNHGGVSVTGGVAFVDGDVLGQDKFHERTDGILFGRTETGSGDWQGKILEENGEVHLSTVIDGDIDGDGDADDDHIYLDLNGGTLCLDKGGKIQAQNINGENQLTIYNGYLQAYSLKYDINHDERNTYYANNTSQQATAPIDYWLYGPNTEFDILGQDMICKAEVAGTTGQHEFFGWVNMGLDTKVVADIADKSYTPTDLADKIYISETSSSNYSGELVNIEGAWGAYQRNVTVVNGKEVVNVVLLATPEEANVIAYGDYEGTLPSGINYDKTTHTFSGTPNVDDTEFGSELSKTYTVTVPITVTTMEGTTSATATVRITVSKDVINITSTTPKLAKEGEDTYDGTVKTGFISLTPNDMEEEDLVEGVHFTVTYSYISNPDAATFDDDAATENVTEIKNAGKYKVTSITGKEDQGVTGTMSNPQIDGNDIIITIKRAELTLSVNNQRVKVGGPINSKISTGENGTISYTGIVEADQKENATVTTISGLTLNTASNVDLSKVGTYTSGIEATGTPTVTIMEDGASEQVDISNNYTIASTIKPGNLLVYLDLSGDDVIPELDPDPTEGEEGSEGGDIYDADSKTFTFPYDGKSYKLSQLTVGEQEIALEEGNVSYSYSETEDGTYTDFTEGQEVKDAGWYKAKVSLNSTLYPGSSNLEYIIHITPRELNVTVADQTVKVGKDQTPTTTWDIVFGQNDNTNTITITEGDVVSGETVVFSNTDDALTLTTEASNAVTNKVAGVYEGAITNEELTLGNGESDNAFKAKNYELKLTAGTLTVIRVLGGDDDEVVGGEDKNDDDDLNGEDGSWDEGEVLFGLGDQNTKVTYDGQAHGIDYLYVKNGDEWVKVEGTLSVTYTSKETDDNDKTTNDGAVDAATYDVTITLTAGQNTLFELPAGGYKAEITINKAPLTVTGTYTCEETPTTVNVSDVTDLKAETLVNNEKVSFSGTLKVKNNNLVPDTDFEMKAAESTAFKASNYEITYNITLTVTGEGGGGDDDKTELDPDGGDVTGGEEGDDGEFPSSDDFILLSPDGETSASVYDGNEHALTVLKFGNTILNVGDDYTVSSYTSSTEPNVGESNLPKHAATYSATVTLTGDYEWNDGTTEHTFTNITINKRPMFVSFVETVSSVEDLKDINKLVVPEKMNNNRGLVTYESPIFSGEIEEPVDLGNGTYRVTIKRETFKISTNEAGNFYLSDYNIHVDTNGNGSEDGNDGEITEGEGGNEGEGGLGDGDDIVIDIEVDPNGEDNDGDGYIDRIDYYNIYEDEICEGVTVEFSRDVVREGQSVLVTVKVEEGFDTTKLALKFKRALFGYWEDLSLTPTENPGEYIIKNIYTDIYVRIEGAVPTGIESIDGAKVYAKDGSLFVQTPQQEKVLIISMTGAIVKNETQIGLRQYTGLNRGIYVVCVGDERFKVRL